MQGADFRRRIIQAGSFLSDELDLVRTVSSLVSLAPNTNFNSVALDKSSTYSDIYRAAISLSYYNVMLSDFSIFQYSFSSSGSWRLAYFPNPWISGVEGAERLISEWEALESLGHFGEEEVANLIAELPYHSAVPAIRFEYAVDQYREMAHPAAHIHIGRHSENRWALIRPLDPLTFTMMVVRLYYPLFWNCRSSFHGFDVQNCVDLRFIAELKKMPLAHNFTDTERRSFHLTSQ